MNVYKTLGPFRVYCYHDHRRTDAPDLGPIYAGLGAGPLGFEVML